MLGIIKEINFSYGVVEAEQQKIYKKFLFSFFPKLCFK